MSASITMNAKRSVTTYINPANGYRRRKTINRLMLALTGFFTLIALIPLFWIVGYVIYKGSQYLTPSFFLELPQPLGVAGGGVLHAIEGTLILTVLSVIFAFPPGILTAFYTAYHPNTPLGTAVRFGTDVLSGVPSIVIGIFGYALIVKAQGHYSAFSGGVAMAILMLPTIIRTTEEMIKLVPSNLREGSLALGSPEWRTSLKVTIPAALSGIITGFMLGIARASGETAPLLFTALGNDRFNLSQLVTSGIQSKESVLAILGRILDQPIDSLPLTLFKYSQQPFPERVNQSWTVALILLALVLLFNIIARVWVMIRTSRS